MAKRGIKAKAAKAAETVKISADEIHGPSPDPATNLLIADLALRGGAMLMRQGLERGLLGRRYAPKKAAQILKGRTMGETLLHTAIAKLATKSVPGAIVVGGGLLAKTLYDRKRGRTAEREGLEKLEDMAESGAEDSAEEQTKATG